MLVVGLPLALLLVSEESLPSCSCSGGSPATLSCLIHVVAPDGFDPGARPERSKPGLQLPLPAPHRLPTPHLPRILQAGAALIVMKWLWDVFARLDADSQLRVADLAFDDPTTVKRVRGVPRCPRLPNGTRRERSTRAMQGLC